MTISPKSGDRVVIIGGGATAAITSVFLAEAGFRVTCLEKANVGNGSSSRSAACIRAQFSVLETALGMAYSEHFFVNFHEYMRTPADERDWMIRQNGYLWLYEDPEKYTEPKQRDEAAKSWNNAQKEGKMHQSIGLPVELLNPQEIVSRWPHLDADRLIGAAFCSSDGFLNHDQIYLLGFRRAKELGVVLCQNTFVTGARHENGRVIAVQTNNGEFPCDWVVNATNAWAPRVSKMLGAMPLRITPLKRYLWFLERQRGSLTDGQWNSLPMTIYGMGNDRGLYSRPFSSKELMMGWAHKTDGEPDFTDEDQDKIHPDFKGDYWTKVMEQLSEFSMELADSGWITHMTGGYYGDVPDHTPFIGHDEQVANVLHAAGCSGHGLMHVPITAHLVRELLLNGPQLEAVRLPAPYEKHTMSLSVFAPNREIDLSHAEGKVI